MSWHLTERTDEFEAAAGTFLRARPARHTVFLSILAELAANGGDVYGDAAPYFGWWAPAGEVTAACLRTPPYPVLVTGMDRPAATALAAALATGLERRNASRTAGLTGVNGPVAEASMFAEAWLGSSGRQPEVKMRTRLYRLERLEPPDPWPAGAARRAGLADADLAIAWHHAFAAGTGDGKPSLTVIDGKLRDGRLVLWELPDGSPVAMAGVQRSAAGVARVGPVYTPPGHRGRGFGSAATAAITQAVLDTGTGEIVLFTDLANPVSNSIYQRLGYRPVEDMINIAFPA